MIFTVTVNHRMYPDNVKSHKALYIMAFYYFNSSCFTSFLF
jgi:hypothetical protein